MSESFLYTIVEEHYFTLQLRRIQADAERADEFISGAKWVLARDPTIGFQISDVVWFLPMADTPETVAVNLYYTFDETRVYFLAIEIA